MQLFHFLLLLELLLLAHQHNLPGERDERNGKSSFASIHHPGKDGDSGWKGEWVVKAVNGKPGTFRLRSSRHNATGRYLAAHAGRMDNRDDRSSYVCAHDGAIDVCVSSSSSSRDIASSCVMISPSARTFKIESTKHG